MSLALPPNTAAAPVRTAATVIEHSGYPWPPRVAHVQMVTARRQYVAAIDFYPAPKTTNQGEPRDR